jgi:hypothetical protein
MLDTEFKENTEINLKQESIATKWNVVLFTKVRCK